MKCKEIEPLLYLVREGEVSAEEEKQVALHLAECQHCRQIYESVVKMTGRIRHSDFTGGDVANKAPDMNLILQTIQKTEDGRLFNRPTNRQISFLKGIAAALLVLMASTFVYQETEFRRQKSVLMVPLRQTEKVSAYSSDEADCLNELKRRYKIRAMTLVPQENNLVINKISEEQLKAYVQQVCGSDAGDINKLKEMLMQAGLIRTDHLN